ncbi:hypothetical protein HYE18_00845 [Mycoplasmopsis bovis]|nr:hypothetical protein [Mycoplasmopsis bovis]QQH24996.1 hypothetical protein HYE18_00845 [Mycoplasmopsis bovis]
MKQIQVILNNIKARKKEKNTNGRAKDRKKSHKKARNEPQVKLPITIETSA